MVDQPLEPEKANSSKNWIYSHENGKFNVPKWVLIAVFSCSLIACIATIHVAYLAVTRNSKEYLFLATACWAVVPPAWFWVEYFWLYKKWGDHYQFERFKYGQGQSKAIWAGIVAALIALLTILDDAKVANAKERTGITETASLMREALDALIQREAAHRLAALGGTMPDLEITPQRPRPIRRKPVRDPKKNSG